MMAPVIRALIYMTPDSTTVDPMGDPQANLDINVWAEDSPRAAAIAIMDDLLAWLPHVTTEDAAASLRRRRKRSTTRF